MSAALPFITKALPYVGTALNFVGTLQGGSSQAAMLESQARVAREQAGRDEEAQRREGRQALGAAAAAAAESGAGMGGSNALLIHQSAVNAEMDALNIRYGGAIKAAGLLSEAKNIKRQTPLLAGGQLLSGLAGAYTQGRQVAGLG